MLKEDCFQNLSYFGKVMTMLKVLFLTSLAFLLYCSTSAGQVSHCIYGITVKELLQSAGISGSKLLSIVAKLEKENIDETILSKLTLEQLRNIGITTVGDRLKIHKFFANDANDCTQSLCENNGICHDSFRCFLCRCDRNSGYYGPSCAQKCPCKNGGHCKTTRTGFICECAPGFSGDLCETIYLSENKFAQVEKKLLQLTAELAQAKSELVNQSKKIESQSKKIESQSKKVENLETRPGKWKLYRSNEVLDKLEKIQFSGSTYIQKLPINLPKETEAILISVHCNFAHSGMTHAHLDYEAHQKGNDKPEAKVYGNNRHYNAYYNTFYYEQMVPWNNDLADEMVFKVTFSSHNGASNWYRIRLVGYITTK